MDTRCINTIRCITPAALVTAKSGHPGAPMGCAMLAHVLWSKVMRYDPSNPEWINRDRFVLSNGHACALQYFMLHLLGYPKMGQFIKEFRKIGSKFPGHPERGVTPGIEVTTGPLGQGLAQAVGLSIASISLSRHFNKPDINLFQNYIYCVVGDGCVQEGITHEASSLAGHLGLGNLIVMYDANKITIDGSLELSMSEDVVARYKAYNWHVQILEDGNSDIEGFYNAVMEAKRVTDQPSLIICKTIIAYGSKLQGTAKSHGSPLDIEDIKNLRKNAGIEPHDDIFAIPEDVATFYSSLAKERRTEAANWYLNELKLYSVKYADDYNRLLMRLGYDPATNRAIEFQGDFDLVELGMTELTKIGPKGEATRISSQRVMNIIAQKFEGVIGGSADLTPSNMTALEGAMDFSRANEEFRGRYIRYGVREHGMIAVTNGIAAFGCGFKPYCATFLNFVTYGWGAARIAALSDLGILVIATHDSIELGEDGPTHQPIETAALIRATPNALFLRPADYKEVLGAYTVWMSNPKSPMFMALCRSDVPTLENTDPKKVQFGAYILRDFDSTSYRRKIILAGSGSELHIALQTADLIEEKLNVRVVSMVSWEVYANQPESYRSSILPFGIRGGYIEALAVPGLTKYFCEALSITMDGKFGLSGSGKSVQEHFGFNAKTWADKIIENYLKVLEKENKF